MKVAPMLSRALAAAAYTLALATAQAQDTLKLAVGQKAYAIVKSDNVIIGTD